MSITVAPAPVAPLLSRAEQRRRRQHAAAELRKLNGWSKNEMRDFYERLVHHDRLREGRAVVDAIRMCGR